MRMFITVVCAIAALLLIKMMDLPGLITALLVIAVVGFVIYSFAYSFAPNPGKKKTDTGE